MKIYLAGPEVFLPEAIDLGEEKKSLCLAYGFVGLFPFDNEIVAPNPSLLAGLIFDANIEMIQRCDAVVANLSPFRGPSADVGTVYECGVARGLGKMVIGYSSNSKPYLERVGGLVRKNEYWYDKDGRSVEDFGLIDNLMIAKGVDKIYAEDSTYPDPFHDLSQFEECLIHLRELCAG